MSLTFPVPFATVSFLLEAAEQITSIAAVYGMATAEREPRPEAIRKLQEAVDDAKTALMAGRIIRRRYPSTYEAMARKGEEWLLVHRYWFGYVRDGDEAIVFAVLDQASDMPERR